MTAWVVRAGRYGEREQWALQEGKCGVDFHEIGDLTSADTKDKVWAAVQAAFAGAPSGRQANFAGQMWALRGSISAGDLVVMPLKTASRKVAIGVVTSGYAYDAEAAEDRRHTVTVDWRTSDVSRAAIKDDLINTLNGAMTVFQASKHNAEARLRALMRTGVDPGMSGTAGAGAAKSGGPHRGTQGSGQSDAAGSPGGGVGRSGSDAPDTAESVVDPDPAPTLEAIRDRVRTHLVENFKGHRLTELVAAILRVRGYVCDVSPPGPDQGVDIIAGRGPLGLDAPTLIVEVKSEDGPVGSTVTRGLQGAISQHRADQGLLVAWGGLNRNARAEIRTDRLSLRVWEADDVIEQLFDVYDRLPDEMRLAVPLKRTWVLDQETG